MPAIHQALARCLGIKISMTCVSVHKKLTPKWIKLIQIELIHLFNSPFLRAYNVPGIKLPHHYNGFYIWISMNFIK